MTESASPSAASSVCPRCGSGFRCGMVAGDKGCWCAALPPLTPHSVPAAAEGSVAEPSAPAVPSPTTTASCFCPACLKLLMDPSHR